MLARFLMFCLELSRNQWLSKDELTRIQQKRLKAVLIHAYDNVELYHKEWKAAGVRPSDIRTTEDIVKLPMIEKREILAEGEENFLAKGYGVDRCVKRPTSGSSGGPMSVYYDRRFWDYVNAAYFRLRQAMGIRPWHKVFQVQFWGLSPSRARTEGTQAGRRGSHYKISLGLVKGIES